MTLEDKLARAICEGFWEAAERPRIWEVHSPQEKAVWTICARKAIAAAHEFKAARSPSRDHAPAT